MIFKFLIFRIIKNGKKTENENLMTFISEKSTQQQKTKQKLDTSQIKSSDNRSNLVIKPEDLMNLIRPLINETLVNEINTLYEFDIKNETTNQINKFYVNLKYNKGSVGSGSYLTENSLAKVDCTIKINENDLNDILLEKLTPFGAYMSQKIQVDGSLYQLLQLKKLLSLASSSESLNELISKRN